jgi:hypothetical protein
VEWRSVIGPAFPAALIVWSATNPAGTTVYECQMEEPTSLPQVEQDTVGILQSLHRLVS